MTDVAWIDAALRAARPQALSALLRHFLDLDQAEEALQEANLRALQLWPQNGPPRDTVGWLVFVGQNLAEANPARVRTLRAVPGRRIELGETPERTEVKAGADYRDDVLRLLFLCCHPELPATLQLALSLRLVSGLTIPQIARAFLVSEAVIEDRIARAKTFIAAAEEHGCRALSSAERLERVDAVSTVLYLIFNEGYSATGPARAERALLADEAIRLARLLLRLYRDDAELMSLLALFLLQHARTEARFDASGAPILLEEQDRTRWNRAYIAEGFALLDKAARHGSRGSFQIQAGLAAVHARAARAEDTDWAVMEGLYRELEHLSPSPVVRLNRAVALSKLHGPEAALDLIEPLAEPLAGYFLFHGVRGSLLLQLGRNLEARGAMDQAIALASSPAEAAQIRQHLDRLVRDSAARASG